MLTIRAMASWAPSQVHVTWVPSGRTIVPQVEETIEQAWQDALRRPRVKLFDGPMCRLEAWSASAAELRLTLSNTSYKPFLGTNLANPQLIERFGPHVLASPLGVSTALETSDGFLLLGRRNASVAYYPNRIHPFAGALEPRDKGDVFAAVLRELKEELSLAAGDVPELRCIGLVEDHALHQPELIFHARASLTCRRIESQVHGEEHGDSVAIASNQDAVGAAVRDPALTPVAVATLLLWGRMSFGQSWFEAASARSL